MRGATASQASADFSNFVAAVAPLDNKTSRHNRDVFPLSS